MLVVACPDRSAGNDPEALGKPFTKDLPIIAKLLQTWLTERRIIKANFYQSMFSIGQIDIPSTVDNMGQ